MNQMLPIPFSHGELLEGGGIVAVFTFHDGSYEAAIEKGGVREGEYLLFYPQGAIKQRSFYHQGRLHGLSTTYTEEGILIAESCYDTGKLVGMRRLYYPNGALFAELDEGSGGKTYFHPDGKERARY